MSRLNQTESCHLCATFWQHLQFQVILLHKRRHEPLTFPNRPLSHESCLVCRLVGWQCVHNIVLSQHLADYQIQTRSGFSHLAELSSCNTPTTRLSAQKQLHTSRLCLQTSLCIQQHIASICRHWLRPWHCCRCLEMHSCNLALPAGRPLNLVGQVVVLRPVR